MSLINHSKCIVHQSLEMKTLKICRSISVKGGREYPFEVTHTIEYHAAKGCGEESKGSRTRFKSTRNYIVYDSGEEVVRYAMTSKVVVCEGVYQL